MVEEKTKDLLNDVIAKKVFSISKIGFDYAVAIISEVLKISKKEVAKNLEYVHPEISVNTNIVNSETDVILKNNSNYINIEINYSEGSDTRVKNRTFLCQLYLRDIKDYKKCKDIKPIIQINIDNYDYFGYDEFIYHSTLREEKYNIVEDEFLETYHVNLAKLRKVSYNEIEKNKLMKLLYIFVCENKEILDKLYKR